MYKIVNWSGHVIETFQSRLSAEVYLMSLSEEEIEDYYIVQDIVFDTFPDMKAEEELDRLKDERAEKYFNDKEEGDSNE